MQGITPLIKSVGVCVLAGVLILLSACSTHAVSGPTEPGATGGSVTVIQEGKANIAIYAPAEVVNFPDKEPDRIWNVYNDPNANRARLRESVKDLAATLEKISGAKVDVVAGLPAADDTRIPVLVGDLAVARFGPPKVSYEFKQGFRYVVTDKAIGLMGESDLATSYAVYELLDRLGCRMYMPGELGWCVPNMTTVKLAQADYSGHPYTHGRFVWYADNNYGRRNRLGGLYLSAGHALEMYITKDQRKQHPEWMATVDGKPHAHRLKWSAPGLSDAIADAIIAAADKSPKTLTFSLSPDDGMGYDNSAADQALDAGDMDESIQQVSFTDRLVWFCNKIVAKVKVKHPDLIYGMLAYTPYSRPPVREKIDPAIIPQIAPITFSRAHPMNDDGEPNNKALRFIVEGWAKAAPRTSYYFYSWFLAEFSGPNPMIKKWSFDVPYVFEKGNCYFWQPETITNFESSFHAYAIGFALAWDPKRDPKQVIAELNQKFYGHAAREMTAYWDYIDYVWYSVPEYSGCGFGHMRRWTTQHLNKARELMELGKAAAVTQTEKDRIAMADASLKLFEDFMKMRRELASGQWADLATQSETYTKTMVDMGNKYKDNHTFGKVRWSRVGSSNNSYFDAFYRKTYIDAARLAKETDLILKKPVRNFKYIADTDKTGETKGFFNPTFDDKTWKPTDVSIDTWSALGLHNYMGTVWYRTNIDIPWLKTDKQTMLWVGATDGSAEVWVNGKKAKYIDPKGKKTEFDSYCEPASFDVTGLLTTGNNQVTIKSTRTFINELGTGGLLAPITVYQVK